MLREKKKQSLPNRGFHFSHPVTEIRLTGKIRTAPCFPSGFSKLKAGQHVPLCICTQLQTLAQIDHHPKLNT